MSKTSGDQEKTQSEGRIRSSSPDWRFPATKSKTDFDGPVTYSSYQVKTTNWINSYRYLGLYAKKASSAWTEVCTATWPSTAPITAPGGRSGQISTFLSFWAGLVISIARQVCLTTAMNHVETLIDM